ncbi:uncharacterized protein LOC130777170 [Actinidia eriantha]|uniref:uncharacterized protein LOC130777170 n=1 Tax=Actinidia eriantha TaxID=165200 RepID=UPI00258F055C|nr:uncharacterized protein LOC130777170 [Actinidia eriantha]
MAIKHELPQDLLMEILSRLPVRSILYPNFGSLSYETLSSLPSITIIPKKKGYFVSRLPKLDFSDYVFSLVLDESLVEDIKMPFTGFNLRHIKLYASSNGLLCLVDFSYYPHKFVICNLAMKEFREYNINPNVKYDPDCNVPVEEKVHIYDLSTDSWREVDAIMPKNFTWASTLKCLESLNGFVYWLVDGEIAIIGFRLFDELFEEIPVPDDVCWVKVELLCALNDSLALIFDTGTGTNPIRLDIWVQTACSLAYAIAYATRSLSVEQAQPIIVAVVQYSLEFAICYLEKSVSSSDDLTVQGYICFISSAFVFA